MSIKPVDTIAFMATLTICITLAGAFMIPIYTGQPLSEVKAEVVAKLFNDMSSVITLYVGSMISMMAHRYGVKNGNGDKQ